MYADYYGFREKPFTLQPDPRFLFLGRHHRRALTLLEYGLVNESSFLLVTGEVGCGKTTLIRYLLSRLDDSVKVGLLSHTSRGSQRLLPWVCYSLGLEAHSNEDAALYEVLVAFLVEQYRAGHQVMLIVDEAQNLGLRGLEELRLLSNISVDEHLLLQLVMVGQPELARLLQRRELRQVAQRIGGEYHIGPMTQQETMHYVWHRLRVAGGPVSLFSRTALRMVHASSGGVPRLVNQLCDVALLYGYTEQASRIDEDLMETVIRDRCEGGVFPGLQVRLRHEREVRLPE